MMTVQKLSHWYHTNKNCLKLSTSTHTCDLAYFIYSKLCYKYHDLIIIIIQFIPQMSSGLHSNYLSIIRALVNFLFLQISKIHKWNHNLIYGFFCMLLALYLNLLDQLYNSSFNFRNKSKSILQGTQITE